MPFEQTYSDGTGYGLPTLTVPQDSSSCDFDLTPSTEVPIHTPNPFGSQINGLRVRWAGLACCHVTYRVCIYLNEYEQGGSGGCISPPDDPCLTRGFNIGLNSPTLVFRSGCDHSFRITGGASFETWGDTILNVRLRVLKDSDNDPSCGTDQEVKIKFCVDATEDTTSPASWTTVVG